MFTISLSFSVCLPPLAGFIIWFTNRISSMFTCIWQYRSTASGRICFRNYSNFRKMKCLSECMFHNTKIKHISISISTAECTTDYLHWRAYEDSKWPHVLSGYISHQRSFVPNLSFFFFFLFGSTCSTWKFPGQGSNPSHGCDLNTVAATWDS